MITAEATLTDHLSAAALISTTILVAPATVAAVVVITFEAPLTDGLSGAATVATAIEAAVTTHIAAAIASALKAAATTLTCYRC